MAEKTRDIWLKLTLGFLFALSMAIATMGANAIDRKADKEALNKHEIYQDKQFSDMKEYQREQFDSFEKYIKAVTFTK
jgi:hypothetical protein